jgi:hypothetical protein
MLLTEPFLASEKRHYGRIMIVLFFRAPLGANIILFVKCQDNFYNLSTASFNCFIACSSIERGVATFRRR